VERVVKAAVWPSGAPLDERLLVLDSGEDGWTDARVRELGRWVLPGDVLVLNDAATLPASFFARTSNGARLELRLAARVDDQRWLAVLFGEGDWHTRTEDRPPPPRVEPGDALAIAPQLWAVVESVDATSPRLIVVRFSLEGAALWAALYRHGHAVQYAHVAGPLALWHVQTPFASRPWSVEMPSAARPLAWALVDRLRRAGVRFASLTHAAGLSSTGDARLDARLPLPERYEIPAATIRTIDAARAEGGRVVAVGTTAVRALEGCAASHGGTLVPGEGVTDLRIDAAFRPRVVDALVTGLHELGTSHRSLLQAFAPEPLIARAWNHAESDGYESHEFGDLCLVISLSAPERARIPA
jgi:S-adenosylmethionine:tRNA ribosyltransferase-isomerase